MSFAEDWDTFRALHESLDVTNQRLVKTSYYAGALSALTIMIEGFNTGNQRMVSDMVEELFEIETDTHLKSCKDCDFTADTVPDLMEHMLETGHGLDEDTRTKLQASGLLGDIKDLVKDP